VALAARGDAAAEERVELAGAHALDQARAAVHRAVEVAAVVVQAAELLLHRRDDVGERSAEVRDALGDQQAGEDAVALRQEMPEADAAALLAADEDVPREHEVGDVLEADGSLVKAGAEGPRDFLDEPC